MTDYWKKGNKLSLSEPGAVSGDPAKWLHDGGTVSATAARDALMVGEHTPPSLLPRRRTTPVPGGRFVHLHRWRAGCWRGAPYAKCVACGAITLRPWWPRWVFHQEEDADG